MIALWLACGGCLRKVELYCETHADCAHVEGKPFCDVNGEYPQSDHVARTCIECPMGESCARPIDAGEVADAASPDAPPPGPDAQIPWDMLLVPAGTFTMGCNFAVDTDCDADESPPHQVTLSSYLIDRFETRQADYESCVLAAVCATPEAEYEPFLFADYPVIYITYPMAWTYCNWKGKRLPTEAEWEYAARGEDGRKYPWGNDTPTCSLANYGDCVGTTQPIGSTPAGVSPFGVMEMAGNVIEWVNDWYATYTDAPVTNPQGPLTGGERIRRGGAYFSHPHLLRASDRHAPLFKPTSEHRLYGIRCAADY